MRLSMETVTHLRGSNTSPNPVIRSFGMSVDRGASDVKGKE